MVGVDWSDRGEYKRVRHGIDPAVADEALADPDRVRLNPDPSSRSGQTTRTIGYSPSARLLVSVILLDTGGKAYGVNGWPSNGTDRRRYERGQAMSEQGLDRLLRDEAEHAERHVDAEPRPETTITRPGRARSTVFSVRLNQEEAAELQQFAEDEGLPASTLVRSWIIERLRSQGLPPEVRALIHDEVRAAVREEIGGNWTA